MKIRSMQTCIMSSLPHCIFRCSVFRYVTLVSFVFFVQTLLFNCNSFTLVANKYLLTYLILDTCRPRPTTLIYATKKSLRALESSANWTQKGGWYPGYQNSKCSRGGKAV